LIAQAHNEFGQQKSMAMVAVKNIIMCLNPFAQMQRDQPGEGLVPLQWPSAWVL
jgi:hypothetical protein